MNDIGSPSRAKASKAVDLIDQNLAKLAATLEDIADRVAQAGANGDVPANFTSTAVKQIESLNGRLQSIDGEKLVTRSKETIGRHPTAFTIVGAIAGAVMAQAAILTLRNQRQRVAQPHPQGASAP